MSGRIRVPRIQERSEADLTTHTKDRHASIKDPFPFKIDSHSVYTCVCVCKGVKPEEALDPLDLELQVVVGQLVLVWGTRVVHLGEWSVLLTAEPSQPLGERTLLSATFSSFVLVPKATVPFHFTQPRINTKHGRQRKNTQAKPNMWRHPGPKIAIRLPIV